MANNEKLTKEKIEQMAKEVYMYLVQKGLWYDTAIFFNGKKMTTSVPGQLGDGKMYSLVDNVDPGDVLEYYNHDHILSMTFEGPLYHAINGYSKGSEKVTEKLRKIFSKYGVWYEQGYAWSLTVYPN